MSSSEAAEWVINEYKIENQNWGEALIIMPHRSWFKNDQLRLAEYYFRKIPFASSKGYEVFLSFMSLQEFLEVIRNYMPHSQDKLELLKYYLMPLLEKRAQSEKELDLVNKFVEELS